MQAILDSTLTIKDYKLDRKDLEARLNAHCIVDDNDCWVWTGYKNHKGYGRVAYYINGKTIRLGAHRLSYLLHTGEDPGSLCVCHKCDNPSCINPQHLFLGTIGDNNRDAFRKGRNKTIGQHRLDGEHNSNAKYTKEIVREIRSLYKNGWTINQLVEKFDGSRGGIYAIVNRINWANVD